MFIPEHIKVKLRELNCEEIAVALGLEVRKHYISCPLHEDKTPSLHFKGSMWKCFSCGESGDAISFVMMVCSMSFVDACVYLCDKYNIKLIDTYKKRPQKPKLALRTVSTLPIAEDKDRDFDTEVAQFVIDNISLGDEGKKFLLEERKLEPNVVVAQQITSIEQHDELFNKLLSKFEKERLVKCKILNDSGSRINIPIPSLIIPYFGLDGKIVSLQTRYLGNKINVPRFKLLCNSHVNLYNLQRIRKYEEDSIVLITEGITDCLSALSAGYQAVAIQSATSIPNDQLYLLKSFDIRMIPDNDNAGQQAFAVLFKKFLSFGVTLKKVLLPQEHKDYSGYYQSIH